MSPREEITAAAQVLHENPDGPDQFEVNLTTSLWMAVNSASLPPSLEEWLTSAAARWDEIRGRWEAVHALAAARAVIRTHDGRSS